MNVSNAKKIKIIIMSEKTNPKNGFSRVFNDRSGSGAVSLN